MRQQEVTGRLARWVFRLQSFSFKVTHRKGKDHIVPDALSRISADEIASYELIAPEIDLESTSFLDPEYLQMKAKIIENSEQFPDLQVVDRFVYIRTEHVSGNEELDSAKWKLWVPEPLRASAIRQAHDSIVNAHGGMQKSIERLRRNFYWPGLSKEVRDYIRNCEICKETKAPNMTLRPPMGQQSISVRPFQKLYVDILGPYPRSKKGNIGLLIVLDHFSRYHWLCPLRKFTTSLINEFLSQRIFPEFGVPEVIVSDNGVQFKANEFEALLTKLGTRHVCTALHSPQSNAAERVNRSLLSGKPLN